MRLPSFARFLVVGSINTGIGFAVILLLQYGVGLDRRIANAGGYLTGGAISYLLNRHYAFESQRAHGQAIPAFILAALLCFGLNLAVLEASVLVFHLPNAVAQATAVCSYTLAFYMINRYHIFRS